MEREWMYRTVAGAILAAVLGISGYHRRKARQTGRPIARGEEEPWVIAARLAVGLPTWLAVILYVVWPLPIEWARVDLPPPIRWAGAGVAAAMIPVSLWIFRTLGANVSETSLAREGQTLVTRGPYRWVRHPLYSASITWLAALGLLAANALIVLMALACAACVPALVRREETALIERFGAAYRDYMEETGRLLPRVLPPRSDARRS